MNQELRSLLKEARKIIRTHARSMTKDWDVRATKALADTDPSKQEEDEPFAYLLPRQDRSGYETGEKTDYGAIPVYIKPQTKQAYKPRSLWESVELYGEITKQKQGVAHD